jgi:hypothetical protein
MAKAIKSTNPLKPTIMKLLKAKSGATKVTCVEERTDEDGNVVYYGSCMARDGRNGYKSLGGFTVRADVVLQEAYKAHRAGK